MNRAMEIKIGITAALTTLTAFWGWFGWLVVLWILCLILDYATGTVLACKAGTWSSTRARSGIFSKVGSIIVVLVTGLADLGLWLIFRYTGYFPFSYTAILCPIVLSWYILTEMGSILENAGQLGAPLPHFLIRWIAVLQKRVNQAGEAIASLDDE